MPQEYGEKKPGREELKADIEEAADKAIKKNKPKRKPRKRKGRKSKYDDMVTKELYQLVKQKRDAILKKKGIPARLPRGRAALISICKKIKR